MEDKGTHADASTQDMGRFTLRRLLFGANRLMSDLALVWMALFIAKMIAAGQVELRLGDSVLKEFLAVTVTFVALAVARRLHRIHRRYLGLRDAGNVILVALSLSLVLLMTKAYLFSPLPAHSLAEITLFGFLTTTLLLAVYLLHRPTVKQVGRDQRDRKRVVIVGAGDAGEAIVREALRDGLFEPVAFVDDDTRKIDGLIHQVPVMGVINDLPRVIGRTNADEVILATPSANTEEMRRIYQLAAETRAKVRTLPPLQDLLSGDTKRLALSLRDIQLEDLLNREPVKIEREEIAGYVRGQRVLITGAGGSIGSELARQISEMRPSQLILFGRGENSIYQIQQELIRRGFEAPECVIADVRDRKRMETIFAQFRPNLVFHAAAHKHVPLMQANPIEAVLNNVFGTMNVIECATRFGVDRCIYISTDKAVEPTSIMGATKRIGEMIVQDVASRSQKTKFSCVRFGNVLGSRGSVVPLMEQQIREGGPVTVTHEEMTRFFMTIPEAVSLILQAGSLAAGGEVYVLDMGTPVKIAEMARDLILMHGLIPGKDIQIIYTGVRPGEKMHEVLSHKEEDLVPSGREKINLVQQSSSISTDALKQHIKELGAYCDALDEDAIRVTVMDLAWDRLNDENPLLREAAEESPERNITDTE